MPKGNNVLQTENDLIPREIRPNLSKIVSFDRFLVSKIIKNLIPGKLCNQCYSSISLSKVLV